MTVLGALSWIDSNASLKATLLAGPIVRQVINYIVLQYFFYIE